MANFSQLVITESGKQLIAKLKANKDRITFTSMKTSSKKYTVDNLVNVVDFQAIQTRTIEKIEYTDPNRVRLLTNFNNVDVLDGYNINSLAVYAKLDKTNEIVFAIATVIDGDGDWISPNGTTNVISIRFSTTITVSELEIESVNVVTEGYAMQEDLDTHINNSALQNVHGSSFDPDLNSIMSRDAQGMSTVLYDDVSANENTIINKKKLDDSIEDVKKLVGAGSSTALTSYEPAQDYSFGSIIMLTRYEAEGKGLNLIYWDELRKAGYKIGNLYPHWEHKKMYFIVKSNKGEFTWTVQNTIDNLKPYFATHLTLEEMNNSVYDVLTLLMNKPEILTALDITGEYGKAEQQLEEFSIYKWGGELV